jgi:hypothetical protein
MRQSVVGAFYRHPHAGPSDRCTRRRQAGSIVGDGTVLFGGADAPLIPQGHDTGSCVSAHFDHSFQN